MSRNLTLKNLIERYKSVLICLFIIIPTVLIYYQVGSHEFINFDDALYVTENQQVKAGITEESVLWAFGFTDRAYWHPVTWLSHMLDCDLFGVNPGMHHFMNLLFHLLNSLLLFFVLKTSTGYYWRSAFVAVLFSLHPVNVDSVAWIAERKNLLSTFFWLLTMFGYAHYVHRPKAIRYVMVLGLFVLGLLSKPMLITLPFVLLLFDYWPFRRISPDFHKAQTKQSVETSQPIQKSIIVKLILEKAPLFLLAFGTLFLSVRSFQGHVDVVSTEIVSMKLRVANALVSYIAYIVKMIWPFNLTIYYPYPNEIPFIYALSAGVVLACITVVAFLKMNRYPYVIVGWLWYLGTMFPMSGVIQAGLWPAMAERWAYVPFIGLFIILSWGGYDLLSRFRHAKIMYILSMGIVVLLLSVISWKQAGYWKNDFTLFSHAIQVNDQNSIAYSCLADTFAKNGRFDDAVSYYEKALVVNYNDPTLHNNYAITLLNIGRFDKAAVHFSHALQKYKDDEDVHIGLGIALAKQGRSSDAIDSLLNALTINPANAQTHFKVAVLFGEQGMLDHAVHHYNEALKIDSAYADAKNNLSIVLKKKKRIDESIAILDKKLIITPDDPEVLSTLAILYSQKADYENALIYLFKIIEIQPDNADAYYNIACVHAKQNKVEKSLFWLNQAVLKGFNNWNLIRTDPDLGNIRETDYFKKIINDKAPGARP